ncbi:MAG: Flp pilus assembly protein CpaB [Pseudomonadota bacterium]|nr:Flp pilus assembly protein CpaB [Pseudomonadota bacterium]MDE3037052.1 Flp pilus assembly protein CpaB [Pseudomonadota bacterium]
MSRRAILLLIAGTIAAFTAISVKNRLSQAPAEQSASAAASRVVIAKHDLSPGSFVQAAQDLGWGVPPPVSAAATAPGENARPANPEEGTAGAAKEIYLYEGAVNLADFNGAVVRRLIHAGDPVPTSALMKSGEGGFMSAVLNQGMRAVSIAVTPTSGNAGFISPGDHVDLIVTHRIKTSGGGNGSGESVVSETFARNVRVVAVDQMLDNPDNKAIVAKTVTVEVAPRQAEEIAVASEMGTISVALRSLSEPTPGVRKAGSNANALTDLYGEGDAGYTRDTDLMQLKSAIVPHVQVIRGDKSETVEFYRGAQ